MKICLISYKINDPISGGQIYNDVLIQSAALTGLQIEKWEGIKYDKIRNIVLRIIFLNFYYLFKTISLFSNDILLLDTDFHARFILALIWARYIGKIKVIGVLHHYCFLFDKGFLANKFHYFLEKFISSKFDFMIINSQFSKRIFNQLSGKNTPSLVLTPFCHSINTKKINARFNPDKLNLLQVGTLEKRKNVMTAIKAVAKLEINFTLNFVGYCNSNQYLAEINSIIDQYNLHNKVFLHGRVDDFNLQNFYSKSSVFILVSKLEGYGMVYAEAMQYGLPIIGSITGAVPELVEHNQNGYLCDPENPDQITEAIIKLSDNATWQRIHLNNLKKASTFINKEEFIKCSMDLFNKFSISK